MIAMISDLCKIEKEDWAGMNMGGRMKKKNIISYDTILYGAEYDDDDNNMQMK